ncbi:hypothetical protein K0M31_007560 [Melipona bicolor]|uniref:Uncharacterized protein n=1 Tax=Melipona bicolor TaxID=60889 RepID=A0AA40KVX3_9HYME|nr:hypothetical protein K0M31_007560 [Melipona bicolor]
MKRLRPSPHWATGALRKIRGTDRDSRLKEWNVEEDSDIFFYGPVVNEQILLGPEKLVIKTNVVSVTANSHLFCGVITRVVE